MIAAEVQTILKCPSCSAVGLTEIEAAGTLECRTCHFRVPVVRSVPRFVREPTDALSERTRASFGYEWTHFSEWKDSGEQNFLDYFRGIEHAHLRDARVLDAGCGMGRHARQIAERCRIVVAVDFSAAIESARENVRICSNVQCVQADLTELPFADNAFDYVYSIGVLHHIRGTADILASLARKARPGGRVRVYLYWKRHGWIGAVLALVSAVRKVTVRLPFGLLRVGCAVLSVGLFAGVVLPYRLMDRMGARRHQRWPLYIYARYPFRVLYNDQFDRFSAPLEQRFDEGEVRAMMEAAGLRDVTIYPMFGWVAEGVR
jgi:SAM-dependent methyltransferase